MAVDGPEQVCGGGGGGWAGAGTGCGAGVIRGGPPAGARGRWVGSGWSNPDRALPGTGSAVSAQPPGGQGWPGEKTRRRRSER